MLAVTMRRRGMVLGLLLAVVLTVGGSAPVWAGSRCTKTTEVRLSGGTPIVSTVPGRVCGVQVFATGTTAWAALVDSPDGSVGHPQAIIRAEPGAAASGDSRSVWFGEEGMRTTYGIALYGVNGRAIVQWGGE